ncbi:hypothetical protein CAEBREN_04796 [Caenorhabditis brenneri]|uniref:Uncharacterized protein n=1 Tax=Caenorhabditis brenneri TaxID=135651 RepID=G0PA99_CAEBE|nr:hypothetical protein CAEBREN_04796 [Caenorhabditis brenneri]
MSEIEVWIFWAENGRILLAIKFSKNMGGQSNYLYHVTSSSSTTSYLLRIHRQTPNLVFADTVLFAILSERGLGPKLYGFFDGGRLEEFLPSNYFTKEDSRNPDDLGGEDYEIQTTTVNYSSHPKQVSIESLSQEIDILEKWAKEIFEHTLVFGHSDLGISNILELIPTKELVLIDCEFANYNCRGFDLTMYLSESAIDYPAEYPGININQELTENPPNLRVLCESYLDADNKLKNRISTNREQEIQSLMEECTFFMPVTHLFWALSSMKHSLLKFENGVDLNVQARDRIAVYYYLKPRSQTIYENLAKFNRRQI